MHVNLVQGRVHVNEVQRAAAHKSSRTGMVVHDATAVSAIYTGPNTQGDGQLGGTYSWEELCVY